MKVLMLFFHFFLLYLSIKYYNNMYKDFINKQKTLW